MKYSKWITSPEGSFNCEEIASIIQQGNEINIVFKGNSTMVVNDYPSEAMAKKTMQCFNNWREQQEQLESKGQK